MTAADFDMSEVDAFADHLGRAPRKVKAASSLALTNVAQEAKSDAEGFAPVDKGDLAGGFFIRGGNGWRVLGNDERQAFFQEFGTSLHGPQPSLYPAAARAQPALEKLLGEAGEKAIER